MTEHERAGEQTGARVAGPGSGVVAAVVALAGAVVAVWGGGVLIEALVSEPEKMTSASLLLGGIVAVLGAVPLALAVWFLRSRSPRVFSWMVGAAAVEILLVAVLWKIAYG